MNICKIGGIVWDVLIIGLEESFEIKQSKNSGTVIYKGRSTLDPIGTYYTHAVTFKRKRGFEAEYDRLYDFVAVPRYDGVPVEIIHNQKTICYEARFTVGKRNLRHVDEKTGKVYWDEFELKIIPMEAQVTPL